MIAAMYQLVYAERPVSVLIHLPDILIEHALSLSLPLFVRLLQPSAHYRIQMQKIFSSYSYEFAIFR